MISKIQKSVNAVRKWFPKATKTTVADPHSVLVDPDPDPA
jgi:hypothetical protein